MAKIYTLGEKSKFVDRFFLSYTEEEKWLNEMASKGMLLSKKTFYRYYFTNASNLDAKYTVELLDHPATNPLSESYIKSKKDNGVELVAHYKCRAYFKMSSEMYESEKSVAAMTRTKSVACMFVGYFLAFITSVIMFCYHCVSCLNFTAELSAETMSSLSSKFPVFKLFENIARLIKLDKLLGDYQSTSVVVLFFILLAIFSFPTTLYFRELLLGRKHKKKIKSASKNKAVEKNKRI